MSINAVVMDSDRTPLPINSLEKIKLQLSNVALSVQTGLGYPGTSNSFHGVGKLTCTNYRMIFISSPALPLFDSFMVTWNKIDEGEIIVPSWWSWLSQYPQYKYNTTIYPLEDERQLIGQASLTLMFADSSPAEMIAQIVRESRWTGHLDPDNTADPPLAYPVSIKSPPTYEEPATTTGIGGADGKLGPN